MMASVTALYAALLVVVLICLSAWVIKLRRSAGQDLYQGESKALGRAVRVHGNFTEYVPLALISILIAELNGAEAWMLHALGAGLLAARLTHAYGLWIRPGASPGRVYGMAGTFTVLACGVLLNLWLVMG